MRIALVSPPYDLIRQGYGSRHKISEGNLPPLGVAYVAAVLEAAGHEVAVIDAPAEDLDAAETLARVAAIGPELIGLSAVTATADSVYRVARHLRRELAGVPIVLGGAHPSCYAEDVLRDVPEIDAVVLGEAEETAPELAAALAEGCRGAQLAGIQGIGYRGASGEPVITEARPAPRDLDVIPRPARHLLPNHCYIPLPNQYKRLPGTSMITSRGCPYRKCAFCFQAGRLAQKYRRHSPERVIAEIRELVENYGIREISFWDDNFMLGRKWIERFCDLMEESRLDVTWSCYGRVDTVQQDLVERCAKLGLWSMFYGLESGNQDLLDNINKGFTLEQARRAIKWTHDVGIETRGSFMLALPGETPDKAAKTVDFAIDLDLTYAQFLPTHPEFGTPLYDVAKSMGELRAFKSRTTASFVPEGYRDEAEIREAQRLAYRRFYFRPAYVWKHLKKVRSPADVKKYWDGLRFVEGLS